MFQRSYVRENNTNSPNIFSHFASLLHAIYNHIHIYTLLSLPISLITNSFHPLLRLSSSKTIHLLFPKNNQNNKIKQHVFYQIAIDSLLCFLSPISTNPRYVTFCHTFILITFCLSNLCYFNIPIISIYIKHVYIRFQQYCLTTDELVEPVHQ